MSGIVNNDELMILAFAVCDERATDAQIEQIEDILDGNRAAKLLYLKCLNLHSQLEHRGRRFGLHRPIVEKIRECLPDELSARKGDRHIMCAAPSRALPANGACSLFPRCRSSVPGRCFCPSSIRRHGRLMRWPGFSGGWRSGSLGVEPVRRSPGLSTRRRHADGRADCGYRGPGRRETGDSPNPPERADRSSVANPLRTTRARPLLPSRPRRSSGGSRG